MLNAEARPMFHSALSEAIVCASDPSRVMFGGSLIQTSSAFANAADRAPTKSRLKPVHAAPPIASAILMAPATGSALDALTGAIRRATLDRINSVRRPRHIAPSDCKRPFRCYRHARIDGRRYHVSPGVARLLARPSAPIHTEGTGIASRRSRTASAERVQVKGRGA
ncbi:MAG: hypothetical protein K0Q60_1209 [Microvirga sp.]|nr:hypothetical protein [Microvirga sp.]